MGDVRVTHGCSQAQGYVHGCGNGCGGGGGGVCEHDDP